MHPLGNGSIIPNNKGYVIDTKMGSAKFNDNDNVKVIRNRNRCMACGHGDITVRVIKICDSAIVKPLWNDLWKLYLFFLIYERNQIYTLFIRKMINDKQL